jgi:hypothetical protein
MNQVCGQAFSVSAGEVAFGKFFATSPESLDLDLYLDAWNESAQHWDSAAESVTQGSIESISFNATASGLLRWCVYLYDDGNIAGYSMNLTFQSNFADSLGFGIP